MDEDNFKISSSTLAVSFVMPCTKKCSVFSVFSCFFLQSACDWGHGHNVHMQFPKGELQVSHCTDQSSALLQVVLELKAAAAAFAQILSSSKDGNLVLISAVFAQLAIYGLLLSQKSYPLMLTFCSGTNMTHFLSSQKAAQIVFKF